MDVEVSPWGGDSPPDREQVQAMLDEEGLQSYSWSNGPGDRYAAHRHSYAKVLYCVEGSIVFHTHGASHELRPGDGLEIAAGIVHSADVGPEGVVCLEAARRSS